MSETDTKPARAKQKCLHCDGHGMEEFPDSRHVTLPYSEYRYLPCPICQGRGFTYAKAPQ